MEQLLDYWEHIRESFPLIRTISINVLGAFAIFIFGLILARWVRSKVRGTAFGGTHVDLTLRPVIASAIFYIIMAITIYATFTRLGVEPTALLAVFGAAGLAIGLALKDTLGNIAAGFMLIILRPLNVGEYIETPDIAGTVQEVGLFSTSIKNVEGVFVYVPNGQIWSNRIQNFGRHTERKLIVNIGVGYDTNLAHAQEILIDAMKADPLTLELPDAPVVLVTEFADSAIILSVRCWLPASDWLANTSHMRSVLKQTLDNAGIEIPFPQRVLINKNK